ncbi:MAG: hypothetical protein ACKOAG_08125 [Candidatus Kapaibacterium sp.]
MTFPTFIGSHIRRLPMLFLLLVIACADQDRPADGTGGTSSGTKPSTQSPESRSSKRSRADSAARETELQAIASSSAKIPALKGRSITVSLCGIDSRLNTPSGRADANHVLRFWLDEGAVEIVDIPRGTFADVGLDSAFNFIANLRAHKGRSAYLKAVADIADVPKIDYYCEVGLSQALGILELLGHKDNAQETLRALRTRHAFATGDYQRSYNQGSFLKQTMMKHFGKSTSWYRDPLLRAGLLLVDSNIPLDTVKYIIDELDAHGFPDNGKCYVHIKPTYSYRLPEYDFTNAESIAQIGQRIDERMKIEGLEHTDVQADYVRRLEAIIAKAAADSARRPMVTVTQLRRIYEQRAWMQVSDKAHRKAVFMRICGLMEQCLLNAKRPKDAALIRRYVEDHQSLIEPVVSR